MRILQKGFTLIELLIVIAVLGVLAVAVLSAINPIEQINRGRDTGSRSDAEQLLSASDRYYASQGYYPWQTGESDLVTALSWTAVNSSWIDNPGGTAVLTKLSDTGGTGTGELKSGFLTRVSATTYNTLYAYNKGTPGDSTYVCYLAKSGSFKAEANEKCLPANKPPDYPTEPCASTVTPYVCLP